MDSTTTSIDGLLPELDRLYREWRDGQEARLIANDNRDRFIVAVYSAWPQISEALATRTPATSLGEDVVDGATRRRVAEAIAAAFVKGSPDLAKTLSTDWRDWTDEADAALSSMRPVQEEGVGEELAALREEVDRFRRPSARDLSTSDPITPLPTFEPRHLLGLALLFRKWCHSDLWGRPNEAELAARQVETAYHLLASHPEASPPSLGVDYRGPDYFGERQTNEEIVDEAIQGVRSDLAEIKKASSLGVEELREALVKCRDKFRSYEEMHLAKVDPTAEGGRVMAENEAALLKAARNREMAEMCDEALSRVSGNTAAPSEETT